MIKTDTIMTLDYFNDFYFLEALKANISRKVAEKPILQFSHTIDKLLEDIQEQTDTFLPNIALRTFTYLFAACVGEARHAKRDAAEVLYIDETPKNRGEAFSMLYQFPPDEQNLKALSGIFEQKWAGSFGGKAWLQIARALEMYFKVPHAAFLDHVIDLQHNNGTVFSKSEASQLKFEIHYEGHFSSFLEFKFNRDMLKDNPGQYMLITRKTYKLIERYCSIFRENMPSWARPKLKSLSDYIVSWGNRHFTVVEKWIEWADCAKANEPDARWLVQKLSEDLFVGMTPSELQKAVKKIEKKAIDKVKDKFPGKMQDIKQEAKRLEEKWSRYCKAEKNKVTYDMIPLKIKSSWGDLEMQFPIPFFGHGEETEYGFKITGESQGITEKGSEKGYDGTRGFTDAVASAIRGNQIVIHAGNHTWYIKDKKLEAALS